MYIYIYIRYLVTIIAKLSLSISYNPMLTNRGSEPLSWHSKTYHETLPLFRGASTHLSFSGLPSMALSHSPLDFRQFQPTFEPLTIHEAIHERNSPPK